MLSSIVRLNLDLLHQFLWVTVFLMFLVMVLVLASLVFYKLHVERRANRRKQYLHQCRTIMIAHLNGSSPAGSGIPKKPALFNFELLMETLAGLICEYPGNLQILQGFAKTMGGIDHFRPLLNSRSWATRFTAVERLGLLKIPEFLPLFLEIIQQDKDYRVVAKSIWALSLIPDRPCLYSIHQVLQRPNFMSSKFTEFIYVNIISSFLDQGKGDEFLEYLRSLREDSDLTPTLKRDIIAASGSSGFVGSVPVIEEYLSSSDETPEMRIACIRSLERLASSESGIMILPFLSDPDWRVRAVAARSAHISSSDAIPALKALLSDRNYHVRMNAARSLSKLGILGISALKESQKADDRFAMDVSIFVLGRLG